MHEQNNNTSTCQNINLLFIYFFFIVYAKKDFALIIIDVNKTWDMLPNFWNQVYKNNFKYDGFKMYPTVGCNWPKLN